MKHKKRSPQAQLKKRAKRKLEAQRPGCGPTVSFILGLLVVCLGWLVLDPTLETVGIWLERDKYVPAQLEVLAVSGGRRPVEGRIDVTGDQISLRNPTRFPQLLRAPDSSVSRLKPAEELVGRWIPVWFHPTNNTFLFRDLRVLPYLADKPLPGTRSVIGHFAASLGILTVAIALMLAPVFSSRRALRNAQLVKHDEH